MAYIYDLTDTWNAGGTTFNAIKMNVTDSASAAGSKLVTLQTNGTEHFSVTKAGVGYFSGNVGIGTSSPAGTLHVAGTSALNWVGGGTTTALSVVGTQGTSGGSFFVNTASLNSSFASGFGVDGTYTNPGGIGTSVVNLKAVGVSSGGGYNSAMAFYTASGASLTEKMRITSAGNVGIGTSSPGYKLEARTDGASEFNWVTSFNNTAAGGYGAGYIARAGSNFGYFYMRGDGTAYVENAGAFPLGFATNGTERMRIDSSGNIGIGTSTPGYTTSGRTTVYLNGTSSSLVGLGVGGTEAGYIGAFGSTALEIAAAGASRSLVLTTNGAERARIDSSGNLLVGKTAASVGTDGIQLLPSGYSGFSASGTTAVFVNRNTSDGDTMEFGRNGVKVGSVSVTTTATSYNTSSDARLKENITDADDAAALIDAIQVRKFDWKVDGQHQRYGFVAQELLPVAPEAVSVPADPDDMMGVDYSKLVPMLVKEIQSLRARVAQLEGN